MSLFEETLDTQTLFQGKLLRVERLTVRLPNGKQAQREIVRHPGAVALLALQGEKVLLVRQYRKATESAFWEIPAGTLEPNESPAVCAQRELIEETGYRAQSLEPLQKFYTAPGFCDERIHLFCAQQLTPDNTLDKDPDEFLKVRAFTHPQTESLIQQGKICDAKTMLALALWRTR